MINFLAKIELLIWAQANFPSKTFLMREVN